MIHAPPVGDICYATTNRQEAVKAAARQVEAVIVVGAANSANSQHLCEVAAREGCAAQLIADAIAIETLKTTSESAAFPLPRGLREAV